MRRLCRPRRRRGGAGDLPAKVRGSFTFVQDVVLTGMWHARRVRPPGSRTSASSATATCSPSRRATGGTPSKAHACWRRSGAAAVFPTSRPRTTSSGTRHRCTPSRVTTARTMPHSRTRSCGRRRTGGRSRRLSAARADRGAPRPSRGHGTRRARRCSRRCAVRSVPAGSRAGSTTSGRRRISWCAVRRRAAPSPETGTPRSTMRQRRSASWSTSYRRRCCGSRHCARSAQRTTCLPTRAFSTSSRSPRAPIRCASGSRTSTNRGLAPCSKASLRWPNGRAASRMPTDRCCAGAASRTRAMTATARTSLPSRRARSTRGAGRSPSVTSRSRTTAARSSIPTDCAVRSKATRRRRRAARCSSRFASIAGALSRATGHATPSCASPALRPSGAAGAGRRRAGDDRRRARRRKCRVRGDRRALA